MINASRKRALLSVAVALGAVMAMPAPATAQFHQGREVLYTYTYYSDATYSEAVGYEENTCSYNGVGNTAIVGTWTAYVVRQPWAYCTNGWLSPWDG